MPRYIAASAPGKVLLSGGYLVTDRAYRGLVFGLSARMHVVVVDDEATTSEQAEIRVCSPQFDNAEWIYTWSIKDGTVRVRQTNESFPRNKFVETTLVYALTYIAASGASLHSISITILADDDYYSHASTATSCPSNSRSRFRRFNVPLTAAHKTGLGSSAALVTALTASLVLHFVQEASKAAADSATGNASTAVRSPSSQHLTLPWMNRIHNLAQAAHCSAQGKIGSGFDVGAAVYGSCIYRRFSPSVLESVSSPENTDFSKSLAAVVDDAASKWDVVFSPHEVSMPPHLRLVMADVDCGSETPGMVRQVMAWRKSEPAEAERIWNALEQSTADLAGELQNLVTASQLNPRVLNEVLQTIRAHIREMSKRAKVPIEPPAQTRLLDACSRLDGVVGGVVPGAGGYDALALLVENRDGVVDELARFLEGYTDQAEDDEEKRIGKVRLLGVREEMEGLRPESRDVYDGWIEL